jgi:hypothetical protein
MALSEYPDRVLGTVDGEEAIRLVKWFVQGYENACLLCAERYVYKDGEVNCHRVYVADSLVKVLGEGWDVVHL